MPKNPSKFQVYNLKENYIGVGKHTFKVVISPKFKTGQDFEVELVNSDRMKMKYAVNYWGRKLNVEFEVDNDTPDGLAVANVNRSGARVGTFSMWIIK